MTLSQLLNNPKLPAEIRHEIVAEMERQDFGDRELNFESLRELIRCSFYWNISEKGSQYWIDTYKQLKALGI
jgi:hypothetical protein